MKMGLLVALEQCKGWLRTLANQKKIGFWGCTNRENSLQRKKIIELHLIFEQ